jgi:membrane protein
VIDNLLRLFPLILSWAAFWLLYSIVPTTQVRNRDAVIGALVAALLFEAGKKRLPSISPPFRPIS